MLSPAVGTMDLPLPDADNSSQFHTLLYTQGGTFNENVIHTAKELGRELFNDLPLENRKAKINSQVLFGV